MSYQIIKNIVETKLQKFIEENELENPDLAFMYFIYAIYNNQEFDDIDIANIISNPNIVDGSQDKQIDVIYIDEDEETEEILVRIFQIKKTDGFSSNILIQLKNGLEWIFEQPDEQLSRNTNTLFISKIKEIRDLIGRKPLGHLSFEIYYITLGNKEDIRETDEYYQELQGLISKYSTFGFGSFNFYTEGAIEIFEKLKLIEMKGQKINKSLNIVYDINKSSLIEMESEKFKSVICTVKAKEIANLVSEDKNDVLFNKNIRKYLTTRGKVNQNILETCSEDESSKLFWCLNNGITMICDSFDVKKIPGNPKIDINNLQIINGCQTSVTLFEALEQGVLKDNTEVLLKIHATTNKDVIDRITVATNNQNPINSRDLRSNEDIQIYYQNYILEKYGFYYERKRNEFKSLSREEKKKILVNEKMGQAYLAIGLKRPHQALGSKGDIYKEEFESVFKKSSAEKLMFSCFLYQYIETRKKETSAVLDELAIYGSFHIGRVMSTLIFKQEGFPNATELENIIKVFICNPTDLHLDDFYSIAKKEIEKDLRCNPPDASSLFNYLKRKESSDRMNVISTKLLQTVCV